MILIIRLTKEQEEALFYRVSWPLVRKNIEKGIRNIADKWIEEDKEGPGLPEKGQ